jgi:sec-independent protein translocase protein TatB
MFDLAWSEIALIAVVALVVIGPKDLPEAVRGLARGIQKLRRMASEFQGHVDEVVREAKLEEVRDQIRDIRNFDIKGEIERHVDKDGELRRTFADDPLRTDYVTRPGPAGPGAEDHVMGPPAPEPAPAPEPPPAAASAEPPAFIPPGVARPAPPADPASSNASADSPTKPTPPATSA